MEQTEKRLPTHIVAAAGVVVNDRNEILLVKHHRNGWTLPGGIVEEGEGVIDAVKREVMEETGVEIDVGELFCISSDTCKYAGYNGVKEVPTKVLLDSICTAKGGTPRPSEENTESIFVAMEDVMLRIQKPAMRERFQAYLTYTGRPTFLTYVTRPDFQLQQKQTV